MPQKNRALCPPTEGTLGFTVSGVHCPWLAGMATSFPFRPPSALPDALLSHDGPQSDSCFAVVYDHPSFCFMVGGQVNGLVPWREVAGGLVGSLLQCPSSDTFYSLPGWGTLSQGPGISQARLFLP